MHADFAMMWRLLGLLFLRRVNTEDCPNGVCPNAAVTGTLEIGSLAPRLPRALIDVVGLDGAKEVLNEAVVLPASMPSSINRLFWRSGDRSGVLLVGPSGLGKTAAVEAAARSAGALVLASPAREVASTGFCKIALAAAKSKGQPVVVIIEALDTAPSASLAIRQCLREASASEDTLSRVFIVATMSRDLQSLSAMAREPFGYIVEVGMPSDVERKQFLLKLFQQISRIDPQWSSALREANVATLANLTSQHTFGEIELLVRRAFIRSSNSEGTRDPVALHHFEQILANMPPQAAMAFKETFSVAEPSATSATSAEGEISKPTADNSKKRSKEVKDPMDGIFGWCNFWLPEALHLPPVVWAMIIFGILAHFMARSTYQPYSHRKNRKGRSSFFGGLEGSRSPYGGGMDDDLGHWPNLGGGNFPFPPSMESTLGSSLGRSGRGDTEGSGSGATGSFPSARSTDLPTAGEPKSASPSS